MTAAISHNVIAAVYRHTMIFGQTLFIAELSRDVMVSDYIQSGDLIRQGTVGCFY